MTQAMIDSNLEVTPIPSAPQRSAIITPIPPTIDKAWEFGPFDNLPQYLEIGSAHQSLRVQPVPITIRFDSKEQFERVFVDGVYRRLFAETKDEGPVHIMVGCSKTARGAVGRISMHNSGSKDESKLPYGESGIHRWVSSNSVIWHVVAGGERVPDDVEAIAFFAVKNGMLPGGKLSGVPCAMWNSEAALGVNASTNDGMGCAVYSMLLETGVPRVPKICGLQKIDPKDKVRKPHKPHKPHKQYKQRSDYDELDPGFVDAVHAGEPWVRIGSQSRFRITTPALAAARLRTHEVSTGTCFKSVRAIRRFATSQNEGRAVMPSKGWCSRQGRHVRVG